MTFPASHLNLTIEETAVLALEFGIHEPPGEWYTAASISCEGVAFAEVAHPCGMLSVEFGLTRLGGATLHRFSRYPNRTIWVGRCRKCGAVCWSCV